jgi:hypothetical protein
MSLNANQMLSTRWTDTSGFIAIDHTNQLIVTAFRGLETFTNLLGVLNIRPSPSPICQDCQVVAGLYNFWKAVAPDVEAEVKNARNYYPTFRIVVVGHSLGGAVATYAAAELRQRGIITDLVSILYFQLVA